MAQDETLTDEDLFRIARDLPHTHNDNQGDLIDAAIRAGFEEGMGRSRQRILQLENELVRHLPKARR